MLRPLLLTTALLALAPFAGAGEFHVATTGGVDTAEGSAAKPLKTISAAAEKAMPGDTITVHAGVYREWVKPPRGGESDTRRIVYRAAPGEKVSITGSEPMKGWTRVSGDIWKVEVPDAFFGGKNPFATVIGGAWFDAKGRTHHTASVWLGDDWLTEAANLDEVMKPRTGAEKTGFGDPLAPLWFAVAAKGKTVIHAQFPGKDPNVDGAEIAVRPTVFTPEKTGVDYITLRGFDLRNAATNWAPPTTGQHGLVSAYWNKGWIVEDNDIHHSRCSGVALGKYFNPEDRTRGSTQGYHTVITEAFGKMGWSKDKVGSHIVRRNRIHHCEQAGVVGSLGCSFSTVEGNEIHDVQTIGRFSGAETAGVKFHGAIDTVIRDNHVYRCNRGVWLDWMAQGAQVTGNLLHDNGVGATGALQDFFPEVNHGPILFANNILLSVNSEWCQSQGIAYAHNFFAGTLNLANSNGERTPDPRTTPFFQPHSTVIVRNAGFQWGDMRHLNNLYTFDSASRPKSDEKGVYAATRMIPNTGYDFNLPPGKPARTVVAQGNVFLKDAPPYLGEPDALVKPGFDPDWKLIRKADGWYLTLRSDAGWKSGAKRQLVTTALLGKAVIPDMAFENADGSPLIVDSDYFGKKRDTSNPFPGPFETPVNGEVKVWPK